ncbi:crotonobetainyl-CoA:carnitine CoA-transferase CaiB-like acyl-CoA transferase [Nitrosospira sp. Nsp2]|nr:crotonobetainyl-CoA:carnitine CoA-transferase CaiB-like acyl-CoA transferase [Nitrosospira sp. Nsp2]
MNMNRTLTGCGITGPLDGHGPEFAAIASSLLYQSTALGMHIESSKSPAENRALSFEFRTPHTRPVVCVVDNWSDASRQAFATENIMQAACGLMSVHGRASGKYRPLGLNYVSTLTAALALQGGAAASIGQLRGLPIRHSSVSMAAAALLSLGQYIAGATACESPEVLLPDNSAHTPCLPLVSSDGIIFELETLDVGPWQKFWTEVGVSSTVAGKGWAAFLLRYAKAISPLPDELVSAISNLAYQHISQICARTGMSICPIRSIDDRAKDDDCRHVWLQGPWEFLYERSPDSRASTRASGDLPLSGLTVIESCRRIQGPLAGHLLALLGATVIRIEPPGGDPLRGMPPMAEGCSARFHALNRLKTIQEVDIKSPVGQAKIKELVRDADVFLHNWAPGKAVLLNLDDEDLAAVNPSLIYAYAAGWATDRAAHCPSNSRPGTDFMTQAYSGVARKIADTSGNHGGSLFTVLDVLGGVVAAQGITIALLNRYMNKVGAKVTSSLMSAATLLCADDFREVYNLPTTLKTSKSIIDKIYDTKQGKIAVECCNVATLMRLAEALEIETDTETADFEEHLDSLFRSRTATEWAEVLEDACVPSAVVIENLADLQNIAYLQPGLSPGSYTSVNSPWSFR